MRPEPAAFIRDNLDVRSVSGLSGIRLHLAHPASRLSRLAGERTPYWAYVWPGGEALARHFATHPESVKDRIVLDLGAGSGLVGIAAAKAGASRVVCTETDPAGRAAIALNAGINGVAVDVVDDVTGGELPQVDVVAAGDVFYDPDVARVMFAFLRRAAEAGSEVLIGDIGRDFLPRDSLRPIGTHNVREFGGGPERQAAIYRLV